MKQIIRHVGTQLSPKRLITRQNERRIIQAFGEEFGLVYFGHVVDDDEYRIVRGLTTSLSHRDLHYCVGTYQTYDVAFVERSDTLLNVKSRTRQPHRWHVMEFDLKTNVELPHVFLGLHDHSESFYLELFTKYPDLRSLSLGNLTQYPPQFLHTYRIYGPAAQVIPIEKLFDPETVGVLLKHFGKLAIEINHHSLYIYSERLKVSRSLLESMLKNGAWLAHHIDEASTRL